MKKHKGSRAATRLLRLQEQFTTNALSHSTMQLHAFQTSGQGSFKKLLIANRGEIAIRICRAAAELGIATAAIFTEEDSLALHTRVATEAHLIEKDEKDKDDPIKPYLNIESIIAAAKACGADVIHPGYVPTLQRMMAWSSSYLHCVLLVMGFCLRMYNLRHDAKRKE